MSPPLVLVLGATSKIGRPLIDELLPDHHAGRLTLVAAVHRRDSAAAFELRGIEARRIDLDTAPRDGLTPLARAFAGVDRLFLLTGYDVRMLAQSKAAIDAAVAAGASHIVHVGAHARPDTSIVHLGWHQLIEAYIERAGPRWTHLHPTSFMQNLMMLAAIGGTGPGVITSYVGDARPSWIDARDIAAVAAAVLRDPAAHAGKIYPLGTEAASIAELAALLAEVTGRAWRHESQEPESFFRSAIAAGADPVYMTCVRNVFERTRDGSFSEGSDIFDTVERLTGRPATSLRSFLERHCSHFLSTDAA
jgi:NAD(P)H dehydrogenase (quinone)